MTIHPQGTYQYNAASGKWAAYSSTSGNLFDLVDGKTTIFYGTNTGTYTGVQTGDYLVDGTNGKTYRWNGSQWVLLLDYKTYTNNSVSDSKVAYVEVQYCLSDSNTSFVAYGSWSTTMPAYVSGKYYWTRTVTYYGDGTNDGGSTPRFYQSGQTAVETQNALASTNNHFWYDNTGAYVTEDDGTYSTGYATRITNQGILQSYNGNLMSSWTNSGVNFYESGGTGNTIAEFGGNLARVGKESQAHTEISPDTLSMITEYGVEAMRIEGSGGTSTSPLPMYVGTDIPVASGETKTLSLAGIDSGTTVTIMMYLDPFTVSGSGVVGNTFTVVTGATSSGSYTTGDIKYTYSFNGSTNILTVNANQEQSVRIHGYSYSKVTVYPTTKFAGTVDVGMSLSAGSLYLDGHTVRVGYFDSYDGSKTINKGTTFVSLGDQVTLQTGTWILLGVAIFEANSDTTSRGVCWHSVTNNSNIEITKVTQAAINGSSMETRLQTVHIANITGASHTYQLYCFQNAVNGMSVNYYWRAVHIA